MAKIPGVLPVVPPLSPSSSSNDVMPAWPLPSCSEVAASEAPLRELPLGERAGGTLESVITVCAETERSATELVGVLPEGISLISLVEMAQL
eukprot:3731285-Pleurochrysis_carterae.AAC.2